MFYCVCLLVTQSCYQEKKTDRLPQSLQNFSAAQLLAQKSAPSDFMYQRYSNSTQEFSYKDLEKTKRDIEKLRISSKAFPGFDQAWRLEGPGNIGARINIIAPHPTNAAIMLLGYSTGGIFKTTDGGNFWYPVFDHAAYSAISAIAYDPSNPDIVYVGTGDHNLPGNPYSGDGVHKSLDGGESWTQMGLAETGIVSKLIVDHANTNTVYAGTMGFPYNPDDNRGLYKSIDGGSSWENILYLGDSTGVIDVVMHPTDNNILLAAGWDRIRNNSMSIISGQGAKIYRSTDAGVTWQMITSGLPQSDQSRIGLTAVPSNPNKYYAEYIGLDFQVQGVYESNDAGLTWTQKSASGLQGTSGGFGWYFGQIRSTPNNDSELYHCSVNLYRSFNGGDNWSRITNTGNGSQHVDMHDLKFDAAGNTWLATDGGLYRRLLGQTTWTDMEDIPTTQFYRIAADPHAQERYYGGAQDNGTSFGDSTNLNNWERIFGADGFSIVFHPNNENIFYVETQNGNIYKTIDNGNVFTAITTGINAPEVRPWDMFFYLDPFDPDVVLTGAQHIYQSDPDINNGVFMQISGNLTESDTASSARRYHFITHQSASTISAGLLFAGTSDGLVWKRADGANWELINTGLPDSYVTRVVTSDTDANRVFVTHSGYKDGDNEAHIYISNDQGTLWTSIDGDLPNVPINDLFIIPNTGDSILFIGTDFGVFGSLNQGSSWELLGQGMPSVPVLDLDIDLTANRLLAGTYGRSAFTIDLEPILNPTTVSIAGLVKSRTEVPVSNVNIQAGGTTQTTNSSGLYNLTVVPESSCSIVPNKIVPNNSGVSILDLILLQRHLVFLDTLPLLGQVAGDVNLDNNLNLLDVIEIQRSLVFVDTVYASGPWGFVPTQFNFTDSIDAFSNPVPRTLGCTEAINNGDFWGVKMGDVSGNASNQIIPEVSNRGDVQVELEKENGLHYLRFYQSIPVNGFQLKLNMTPGEKINIESVLKGASVNVIENELYISWVSPTGKPVLIQEPILSFNSAIVNLSLDDQFENILMNASQGNYQSWGIRLKQTYKEGVSGKIFGNQIYPNPNDGLFSIQFNKAIYGNWSLFSTDGILKSSGLINNQARMDFDQTILMPGIYFLLLKSEQKKSVQKVVIN